MKCALTCICIGSLLLAALSCDDTGGDPLSDLCGLSRVDDLIGYMGNPCVPLASSTNFANAIGTQASISWKLEEKDICTKRHSKANLDFLIRGEVHEEISFKAVIWYQIGYERPVNLTKRLDGNSYVWEGSDEFGVKDAYGDGPGMFILFVDMFFPSTGSWASDSAYVEENLLQFELGAYVWAFK